jgi:hypothetical protein
MNVLSEVDYIYKAEFHSQIRHIRGPPQISGIPRELRHVPCGIQHIRILQNVTSYLFREKKSLASTLKR